MKRYAAIVGGYTIILLSALLPGQKIAAPSPSLPGTSPTRRIEARALWVKCDTLSSSAAVIDLVRRAKKNNFTDLVVQVRSRGNAYYNSQIEPRADELASQPAGFDPLGLTIEEAHRAGIKVHAWINVFLVASAINPSKSPEHLINKHPEWVMVPQSLAKDLYSTDPKSPDYLKRIVEYSRTKRGEIEGLFASPAIPEVKDNIFEIWMDVARRYDVDGLHFDYVRYPSREFDYNRTSLDRFRNEIEKNLDDESRRFLQIQARKNPAIYAKSYPNRYQQFLRDQVTELVGRLSSEAKKVKPKILISAAVFADNEVAARSRFQEWKVWL
ncbi:MAG: family 10 glycosylhydrolase, partial [Acidobacteria bacterium]|nr:family 10 glycosylhydrolase [Acidobacteriota bacterium]